MSNLIVDAQDALAVVLKARSDAIKEAADVCAQAATRLMSNGKGRVNQVDRHTAEVLRSMEMKILALDAAPPANEV